MMSDHPQSPRALADEHTFREIVEGTASETGQAFFGAPSDGCEPSRSG
jgi:hypothetical protein